MSAEWWIVTAIVTWALVAAICFRWVLSESEPIAEAPSSSDLRSVTIYARATYGVADNSPWHEITHVYDHIPNGQDMAGVFTWLCAVKGFTIMAADLACDALLEAIVEQEVSGLDEELAALGAAS